MQLLGVDTGGTFTDFVLYETSTAHRTLNLQTLRIHKVLSTPDAPERAILQGIAEMGLGQNELMVVHGSTVATNAVLEAKGVRTAFITNHGLRDLLTIGRQARRALYDLNPEPVPPPVPRELCIETGGRVDADGHELETLTEQDLDHLRRELTRLAPRAAAISLLFSWRNDVAERRIADLVASLPNTVFVSRSSEVLPEYREYERGMTTWLNASVGPLVEGYLHRLCEGIPTAQVAVMQSAGVTIAARQAGQQAVRMLLSGPAGGLAGAQYVGRLAGHRRLLSFDMGGTSTDVALLDDSSGDELQLTTEGRIGPYPVGVPMVDMHTIGAGGGSIARVDAGGLLRVGPKSAGATPGPACYGRGGREATVTDANLVLGRLRTDAFLGGRMPLDENAAQRAVRRVAEPLGLNVEEAARGIIDLANEHMARALRVMSVQRGVDPRELTLASFGGAGGLHVCALAESLGMRQALVPKHAGVLSALGMLVAPRARHQSLSLNRLLSTMDADEVAAQINSLATEARAALEHEGVAAEELELRPSVDLRYRGQSFTINLPWTGLDATAEAFHTRHEKRYGHRLQQAVELVTLRVMVRQRRTMPPVHPSPASETAPPQHRDGLKVLAREDVVTTIRGPALITETVATTYVAPGWLCNPHSSGSLLLRQTEQAP